MCYPTHSSLPCFIHWISKKKQKPWQMGGNGMPRVISKHSEIGANLLEDCSTSCTSCTYASNVCAHRPTGQRTTHNRFSVYRARKWMPHHTLCTCSFASDACRGLSHRTFCTRAFACRGGRWMSHRTPCTASLTVRARRWMSRRTPYTPSFASCGGRSLSHHTPCTCSFAGRGGRPYQISVFELSQVPRKPHWT